jgi:alpha-galactosidase
MEAWVTDADRGKLPLSFRFHVSMCGSLGIGGNLLQWCEDELDEATYWISRYKGLREIIQLGEQYRLEYYSTQYMSKDYQHGVLFVFNAGEPVQTNSIKVRLQGLQPDVIYEVEGFNQIKSGQDWMSEVLVFPLAEFESTIREIHKKIE